MSSLVHVRWAQLPAYVAQAIVLFLLATFLFDVIHFTLHCFLNSRWGFLRRVGALHQAHHDFFDTELRFHDRLTVANLVKHVIPEYLNQVLFTSAAFLVLDPFPVVSALAFETIIFVLVVSVRGMDRNHVPFETLPESRGAAFGTLVTPAYHALHHVYPEQYYSSWTTLFDRLAGTACQIRGRRIAMTGSSGAFGSALKILLERDGASVAPLKFGRDYTYDDYSGLDDVLRETDILVLCHGSKLDEAMRANSESFIAIIERFRALTRGRRFPVEVWALGSEIEAHPAFGNRDLQIYLESKRAFARHARRYYHDRSLVYRHIVPSAFTSRMGPGLISGWLAARVALFLIRRGFRYIPVTYTGIAFFNYLKFALRWDLAQGSEDPPLNLDLPGRRALPGGRRDAEATVPNEVR